MLKLVKGQYLGVTRQHYERSPLSFIDITYHQKVFTGWHAHERAHITFVLNGGNRETRKNTDKSVSAGQVIFYNSGELHRNDYTVFPSRNLNLEIDPIFFKSFEVNEYRVNEAVQNGRLTSQEFMRLFYESVYKDAVADDSTQMLLLSFLNSNSSINAPSWLERIRDVLHDQWNTWPTLLELAAEAGVHPVTLSKYFHRFFGCTFGAYLRKIKTQHAIMMIRRNAYPLSYICHACGFSDQSHFIRCFKEQTGMLPNQLARL